MTDTILATCRRALELDAGVRETPSLQINYGHSEFVKDALPELAREVIRLEKGWSEAAERLVQYGEKIDLCVEALTWYADDKHRSIDKRDGYDSGNYFHTSWSEFEDGARARAALAKLGDKND